MRALITGGAGFIGSHLGDALLASGHASSYPTQPGYEERPVAVRFSPDGHALYVVDFGVMTTRNGDVASYPETGVVWRIGRAGP